MESRSRHRINTKGMNTSLEKLIGELNEKIPCTKYECDGNGVIVFLDEKGELQTEQCDYCFLVRFPIIDLIKTAHAAGMGEVLEDVKNVIKCEKCEGIGGLLSPSFGYMECGDCGGSGHRLYREEQSLEEILSKLEELRKE